MQLDEIQTRTQIRGRIITQLESDNFVDELCSGSSMKRRIMELEEVSRIIEKINEIKDKEDF